MLTAKVGIEYVANEAAFKESFRSLGTFMVNEAGKIVSAISADQSKAAQVFARITAEQKNAAHAAATESVNAHRSAAQLVEEQEQRLAAARAKYGKMGADEQKKALLDLKAASLADSLAMKEATEKEIRDEVAARKRGTDEEIKLLNQVKAENAKSSPHPPPSKGGGDDKKEGGHGGAANIAGAVNLVEQGVGVVDHFLEKGKEAAEVTEKLELGFSRAGVSEKDMDAVMKQNAATVEELSNKYAVSKEKIEDMNAAYLGAGGSVKNLKQATEDALALSKVTGMDKNAAAKALAGATDPEIEKALTRQGIAFDKNATGADRARIIHEKLGKTEEMMAKQAEGPLGQMQRMENTMDDLQKTIGTAILALIGPILPLITSVMNQVSDLIKGVLPPLIGIVKGIIDPLLPIIQSIIGPIVGVFQKLLPPVADIIGKIAGIVGKLLTTIVGSVMKTAAPILTTLVGALSKILAAISPLIDVVGVLIEAFLPLLTDGGLLPIFQQILDALLPPLVNIITMVAGLAVTLLQALMPVITPLLGLLTDLISMLVGGLGTAIAFIIGTVAKLVEILIGGLTDGIKWVIDAVKYGVEWFKALWNALEPVRAMIAEKLEPIIKAHVAGWNAIKSAVSDLASYIAGKFQSAWDGAVKALKTVGGWFSQLIDWFIAGNKWIASTVLTVVNFGAHLLGLGGVFDKVKGWLGGMIEWVKDAINTVGTFLGLVSDAADKSSKLNEGEGKPAPPPAAAPPKEGDAPPPVIPDPPVKDKADKGPKKEKAKSAAQLAKEAYDKELAALQAALDDENFAIELSLQKQEITEQEAEKQKIGAQQKFDQDNLAAANRHGQDTHKINQALLKDEVALRINGFNLKKDVRDRAYSDEQQALEQRIVDENISESDAKKLRLALERTYYEDLLQITRESGLSTLQLEQTMAKQELGVLRDKKKVIEQIEKDLVKDAKDRRDADNAAKLAELDDASEKEIQKENDAYGKQRDDKEKQYDQMIADADGDGELIKRITAARLGTLEAMERAHQAKIAEIQGKAYEERTKAAVEFGNQVYEATWGKLQAINEAETKAKDDAERKYKTQIAVEREREKDPLKRAKKLHEIDLDYNRQKDEIERRFSEQRHDNSVKNNLKELALQKLHLQGTVRQVIIAKASEAAAWVMSEFQKTAATGQGVLARAGMVAVEIWNNLKSAASSVGTAIANAWEWFTALGPWGWAAAGALTAGIALEWGNIKKTFFADGGILSGPAFAPVAGGMGIAGEAGPELVAPLSKLPDLLGLSALRGLKFANGGGDHGVALLTETRAMRADNTEMRGQLAAIHNTFQQRPAPILMDQNKNILSQEQTQARKNLTKL